jgi:hypothetical protein
MKWEIPLLIDGKSIAVLGETQWIAIAPRPRRPADGRECPAQLG